jgi:hypothetical protein
MHTKFWSEDLGDLNVDGTITLERVWIYLDQDRLVNKTMHGKVPERA